MAPMACLQCEPFNRAFNSRTSKDLAYFVLVHGVKQIKREKLILFVALI